jgi:hypothetical protein
MRNGETFLVNKCSAPGVCGKKKDSRNAKKSRRSERRSVNKFWKAAGQVVGHEGQQERTDSRNEGKPRSQHTAKPLCFAVVGAGNPERGQKNTRKQKSIGI